MKRAPGPWQGFAGPESGYTRRRDAAPWPRDWRCPHCAVSLLEAWRLGDGWLGARLMPLVIGLALAALGKMGIRK